MMIRGVATPGGRSVQAADRSPPSLEPPDPGSMALFFRLSVLARAGPTWRCWAERAPVCPPAGTAPRVTFVPPRGPRGGTDRLHARSVYAEPPLSGLSSCLLYRHLGPVRRRRRRRRPVEVDLAVLACNLGLVRLGRALMLAPAW